jgi:dienelactone hydrolase
MAGSFLWHPATNPVGWVVFLPGSGGLRILGDDHHYLDVAGCLNRSGYSVLLVDYKPAYAAAGNAPKGDAGDKVAWVTGRAVEWMFREHPGTTALPGALVAWSLGAEGALRIVNDPVMSKELRLGAVVMYYPSNRRKSRMDNRLPVLVLAGEQDDVVRAKDVESLVRDRPEGAPPVELHMYRAAHHGFDVASLKKRKVVRILPLVGPRATLQYDPSAAADAEKRLLEFLSRNAVVSRPRRPG